MLPWIGKNIYFLGFMASGKSRIGKAFAQLLGWPFYDTDDLIEQVADKKISQIFAQNGEDFFRQLETHVIHDISEKKNIVVALGGGAVIREKNWDLIKKSGISICLTAPIEVLSERIARNSNRPLLANLTEDERQEKIKNMLKKRNPYYSRAQFIFESTNSRPVPEFVNHIFETLLENI